VGDDALSAGTVARLLGVAVTTLRTWHQRYGLGPSEHMPGRHRRYTPRDLAQLQVMRRLTAEGVPPAEAARWARRLDDRAEAGSPDANRQFPDVGNRNHVDVGRALGPAQEPTAEASAARAGGGFAIPVGRAGRGARGLARAAMRLDSAGMRELLERMVGEAGVIAAWNDVLCPVLVGIGQRHSATKRLVEVEHLISRCTSEVLGAVPRPGAGIEGPRILLACADEEQHSLPLEALAAALAEAGSSCRMLGARVPTPALVDAVNRTGPTVVVVWSHSPATAHPGQLSALRTATRRPLLVLAAGPGWQIDPLPKGVLRPTDLGQAVALCLAATSGAGGQTIR
jgi:DNA-binding transcriptional MerR regulator